MVRTCAVWLAASTVVFAAPPDVKVLFPPGGQRGTKVEMVCEAEVDLPQALQVTAPGVEAVVTSTVGKTSTIAVSIPADLAADRVWFRFYNQEGASELMPFLVGSLPEVIEQETNNSLKQAQGIASRCVVNGRMNVMEDADCYVVQATEGQTLVAAIDANLRIGSNMDPALQIVTPDGFILAENHDDIGFDPVAVARIPRTGQYIVRVVSFSGTKSTSIRFHGNSKMVYRLTVTTGPYVYATSPNILATDASPTVRLMGWNVPPDLQCTPARLGSGPMSGHEELETYAGLPRDSQLAAAFAPDAGGSARVRLWPYAVVDNTGDDRVSAPTELTAPVAVTGWLRSPRQVDGYSIPLRKDDVVAMTVESNRIGSLLDPQLTLTDPAGGLVPAAASVSSPQHDAQVTFTVPVDGIYRLTIRDPYELDSPRRFYRLTVWLEQPDYDVSVDASQIVVGPGKPLELPVKVVRRGPAGTPVGPITFRVLGLPDGTTAADVVSEPTGETSTGVKMVIIPGGSPFVGRIRILATAESPRKMARYVRTPDRLGATFESIWTTINP